MLVGQPLAQLPSLLPVVIAAHLAEPLAELSSPGSLQEIHRQKKGGLVRT